MKFNFNNFLLPKSEGKKSVTTTIFFIGSIITMIKLLIAGTEIGGVKFTAFSGVDAAAVLGALGAIYTMRRATEHSDNSEQPKSDKDSK